MICLSVNKYFVEPKYLILVVVFLALYGCNRNLLVQYQTFEFKKLDIKLNKNKDSLSLDYVLDIPPKSFGKKAIAVLTPIFILQQDSIKFHTNSIIGEIEMDCAAISYKYGGSTSYCDTIRLPENHPSTGVLKIFIFGNYKGAKTPTIFFKKELDLK